MYEASVLNRGRLETSKKPPVRSCRRRLYLGNNDRINSRGQVSNDSVVSAMVLNICRINVLTRYPLGESDKMETSPLYSSQDHQDGPNSYPSPV